MPIEPDQRRGPDRRRQTRGGRRTDDKDRQPKGDCPFCGHWESCVTGGRWSLALRAYIRPRRCLECGERFDTTETIHITAHLRRRLEARGLPLPK